MPGAAMLDSPSSAFGLMLFVYLGMLALTIGGLVVAWVQRSIVMGAVVGIPILLIGWFLHALMPDFADPSFTKWLGWWQTDCVVWLVAAIAGLVNLVALIHLRRL